MGGDISITLPHHQGGELAKQRAGKTASSLQWPRWTLPTASGKAQKTTQATSIAAPKTTFPPGVSRAHQYKINETSKKLPKNMSASACWVYRVIRVWASSLGCFLQELQPVTSTHAGTCSCSWPSSVPSLRTGSWLFLV